LRKAYCPPKWPSYGGRQSTAGSQQQAVSSEQYVLPTTAATTVTATADSQLPTEIYTEATEKELIYYLLKFGDRKLFTKNNEPIPVAEYIISELQNDDLELKNPHYRRLLDEYGKVMQLEADDREKYFMNHPDQDIMRLAIDLLSDHYSLTIKRFTKSEEPENFKLFRDIPRALLIYKSNVAKQQYVEICSQLRDAKPGQEEVELIKERLIALQQVRKFFSDELARLTT
jgi:DNA primase